MTTPVKTTTSTAGSHNMNGVYVCRHRNSKFHGRRVKVLYRWGSGGGPRNVCVETLDEHRTRFVCPWRGLRRIGTDGWCCTSPGRSSSVFRCSA